MQFVAKNKSVQLHFFSEAKEVLMDFDEKGIQHIIQNLLSNAIKFTPNTGEVILHTNLVQKEGQSFLQIKIQDSGHGIAAKDIPNIFSRFYQGKTSNESKIQGTGIGLALTKELIEAYQGNISVESQLEKGSTFTVILPINQNAQLIEHVVLETDTSNFLKTPNEEIEESPPVLEDPSSGLPIVLIVEDNKDVMTYIKSCLQDSFQLHTAQNGQLGIEKAFHLIPDIIISDIMMPEKDGFELVQTLKQDQLTSHIPIVLLTAKAAISDKVTGLQYGADDYIMKPFDKKELLARIENLIKSRQQLHEILKTGVHPNKDISNLQVQLAPEAAFIKKITQAITDQIDNPNFSKNELAKEIHLTPSQLHRKIKALTNKTSLQFIRSIRMEKALYLLQNSNQTIAEISYQVGFNDPNYFSRAFQQEYNMTPSFVRK